MTLTIREHPVPAKHRKTSPGTNARRYITVHETANTGNGADAAAHARLQANGNSRKASWHWTVDDHEAIRSYEHTAICWHAGDGTGNHQSIGVEVCVNADGNRAKALANAAELVAMIAREEQIPLTNVVQHHHWSGKNCPTGLRAGQPMGWSSFMAMVTAEHAALTDTPKPPAPKPPTPAPEEHDDMGTAYRDPRDGKVWIVTPAGRWHVPNRTQLDELVFIKLVRPFDGQPAKWPAGSVDVLDRIPVLEHKS